SLFMHFSGELELHDGIGRADSVGNVLQYRQILRPSFASATEPARAPAGRTAQCGALRASSGRAAADSGASCFGSRDRWYLPIKSRPTGRNGTSLVTGFRVANR